MRDKKEKYPPGYEIGYQDGWEDGQPSALYEGPAVGSFSDPEKEKGIYRATVTGTRTQEKEDQKKILV